MIKRKEFVAKSGLPLLDPFHPISPEGSDWKKADRQYRQFLIAQQGHQYLPVFRRVGSTTILKDFALLADNSEEGKQAIAFYTNELFESGGHTTAPLVYYCLEALEGTWGDDKIKEYAQQAISASTQNPELAQMRDMPERMEREKSTATTEEIKQVEPMMAKLAEIVAEQDEYVQKLRNI
ncbi:hypothetical protein GCM10007390_34380 [Persicitalea jodogahamensis]|uniref:Uncharacterized protein n=1 Tax=Persicitalea jodogahamensis TaxID=402147 RepID=A0A8J3GAX8_9BACT|nr:hypothetical protein GCM10007390_34380 [Persicitalea jodogahamensis]